VFHVTGRPPKVPNVCDNCAASSPSRDDDRPESIRVRMQATRPAPAPLADYYQKAGCSCPSPRGRAGRDLPAHAYGAVVAATIAAGPGCRTTSMAAIHDLTKYLASPTARWQPCRDLPGYGFRGRPRGTYPPHQRPGCTLVGRRPEQFIGASRTRCSPPRLPSGTAVSSRRSSARQIVVTETHQEIHGHAHLDENGCCARQAGRRTACPACGRLNCSGLPPNERAARR